jgi:BirA family biotin operon repressor/biotin-[acetyl-CoA-carboxylase] ligase
MAPPETPAPILPDDEDITLLEAFLPEPDRFVSGEDLARTLGISRVSVWNRMKKLEQEGFVFKAVRNRGYRLEREPSQMHPALLAAHLRRSALEHPLSIYHSIDSTSSECERRFIAGTEPPFCVIAAEQTRGRGRLGRDWHSLNVGNLYCSFGFRPDLPLRRMQTFTLWIGVHLAELIRDFTGLEIKIKWPNDLMADRQKVAGMLTEARIDNDHMRDLIFGVGVNLNSDAASFPPPLRRKAASLAMLLHRKLPLHPFAGRLIQTVFDAYNEFHQGIPDSLLAEKWAPFDLLWDKEVRAESGSTVIQGVARGIDPQGSLRLRLPDGSLHALRAGDVSLQTNY